MASEAPAEAAKAAGKGAGLRFALLIAFIVAAVLVVRLTPLGDSITRANALALLETIRSWPAAPVVFVALYAAAAVLALPGSILTLAGGAIFGIWPGAAYNLAGATIGATLAFLLARYLGRDYVAAKLGGWVRRLDDRLADHGFRAMIVLRLAVVVPFNALNYAAGLTSIKLRDYVLGSAIGMAPATAIYTYFADALLRGSLEARRDAYINLGIAAALLIFISFAPLAWQRWKKRSV